MNRHRLVLPLLMLSFWGCGGETSGQDNTKTTAGTTAHAGTQQSKGGTSAAAGGRSSAQTVLGGTSSIGVTASGGVKSAVTITYVGGAANATGGASNGGTSNGIGGTPSTGGTRSAGGASTVGGSAPSGGTASATGGSANNGGTSTALATNVGGSAPATGGTSASSGGTDSTGGATAAGGTTAAWTDPNPTVCDDASLFMLNASAQYKKMAFPLINNPTKTYIAMTNWWHWFAGQAVAFNGLSYTITGASNTDDNYPAGYPSFYIGSYQTTNSTGSNLPRLVSSIGSVPVVFNTNVTALDNSHLNASLDVWFNTSTTPLGSNDSAPTGGYLMVWLNKPSGRQPRGSIVATAQAIGSVSGTWNVWSDGTCVSYVRTSPIDALTFDLNDFIKNAVSNNRVIRSSWYLAVIFGGFEIWNGGSGAKLNQFCAKVNPVAAAAP